MDFFEAQAQARGRTARLLALFAVALAGTVAALYMAALFLGDIAFTRPDERWWRPELLAGTSLFTLVICGGAALSRWLALRAGGPAVAEAVGGRPVAPDTTDLRERTLINVVEEMALASGLPAPAVYLLPGEAGINAFAAGYSPADAAVAVTEGALARLSRDELQGVIAHEFSHILNGDMRLNTRLSALIHGLLALSVLGRGALRATTRVRWSTGSRRGKDAAGGLALVVLVLAAGLVLLVVGFCGHLFGKLIQAAVSRQREFLADAAAVQFTRNPAGLLGALKKIGGSSHRGELDAVRAAEISHYCFVQNFGSGLAGLFATHPPLEERIRALEPGWDGRLHVSTDTSAEAANPTEHSIVPRFTSSTSAGAGIDAAGLINSAGQPSAASLAAGRALLAGLPPSLQDAAHDPSAASALCLALCLPRESGPDLEPLLSEIAARSSANEAHLANSLHAALADVPPGDHLGLLQLAAPTLRRLPLPATATLLDTLDALVRADGIMTPREFALQKIVARAIGLAARPRDVLHVLAPNQVSDELSLALSTAARIEAVDEASATRAFARAAVEFNGLQPPLAYRGAPGDWGSLDLALEHLAHTPAPFRKRILLAFAVALTADARLTPGEADLLRAFAAALDCPLPPVLALAT